MGRFARSVGALSLLLVACSSSGGGASPTDASASQPDAGDGRSDAGTRDGTGTGDVGPRDGGPPPTACGTSLGACNPVTNAGCMTGEGCYLTRSSMTMMISSQCTMAGRGGWDAPCMAANDCREGFACLGGRCAKLCCGEDHASCRNAARGGMAGSLCIGTVTGTDLKYCIGTTPCNEYATGDNMCPASAPRCEVVTEDGSTNCFPRVNPVEAGMPCMGNNQCPVGFICSPSPESMARQCRRVCNPEATPDAGTTCPAGQACRVRFNNRPSTYGACVPEAGM